jgi:putative polyhydroxyalkanoate system protein
MSRIDIRRPHQRSRQEVHEAVDKLACSLGGQFGVCHRWDGDTLAFERSGVRGRIAVTDHDVHITAELGLLMGAVKPIIEREIERYLDQHLA